MSFLDIMRIASFLFFLSFGSMIVEKNTDCIHAGKDEEEIIKIVRRKNTDDDARYE